MFGDICIQTGRWSASRLFSAVIVSAAALAPTAQGQSINWNWMGGSPHWSIATNWNPIDVPDALNETATIGMAGTYTVELNISPTIQHVLITNSSATLDFWSGRTLTVTEWNGVTNYGTILGDHLSSIVGTVINHGTYENTTGVGWILGPVTNEAVAPAGIRIKGPSSLELYGPTITNNGTIHINYNGFVGVDPTYLHFKANALLDGTGELIMGRGARLTTAPSVTLTQGAGHTIRGKGTLGARLVNDGIVRADDPAFLLLLDGEPKTNNGTIQADAGCQLDFFGMYNIAQDEDGQIVADGGTVNFKSPMAGSPIIVTGGTIASLNGGMVHAAAGDTKLIDATVYIGMDVDAGASLLVGGSGLNNIAYIRVNPTATPSFTHVVFNEDAELSGPGEVILGDVVYARLFVDAGFVGTNGVNHTIRGNGLLRGSFLNSGTVAPGESIGVLDSLSPTTFTQSASGVLEVEVAGTSPSEYDRMTGAAAFVLDGTLRVSVVPPYEPQLGHSFTIISGSGVSGTFASIDGPPPGPGLDWALSYTSTTVVLSVVPCALNITEHPQSQTVCRGKQVTLSVTATGATGYQWRYGGENIDGAAGPTYFISYALPSHSGNYDVVVTSPCGTMTSANASLVVLTGGSGDTTGDGSFNGADVQGVVDAIISGGPVDAAYCAADLNGDGTVNLIDAQAMTDLLLLGL